MDDQDVATLDLDSSAEDPAPPSVGSKDVVDATEKVIKKDKKPEWQLDVEVDLGTKKWRPSAVSKDGKRLLYVALNGEVPHYVRRRMSLAYDNGYEVFLALTVPGLYNAEVLEALSAADSVIYVLDDPVKDRRYKRRHFLAALADLDVPVNSDQRKALGGAALGMLDQGSNNAKGRRLEALLAFVFSQVSDLRVFRRNFRNATGEIDIVLQIDNVSKFVWQKSGTPFILVECKNMSKKANQQIMSVFITKLQTTRRSARLGLLISPKGFSEEAKMQEMRFSTEEICVGMVDLKVLKKLIESDDLDQELQDFVSAALLR